MRKTILLLCISIFSFNVQSQDWLALSNGDTVNGEILTKNFNKLPKEIKIKNNNQILAFGVDEILSIGNEKGLLFNKYTITYIPQPNSDFTEYSLQTPNPITTTALLKILVKGKITLAQYMSSDRSYFFEIQKNQAVELVYNKGIRNYTGSQFIGDPRYGKTLISDDKTYVKQIRDLASAINYTGNINDDLQFVEYDAFKLADVFKQLNGIITVYDDKTANKFVIMAGYSSISSKVSGTVSGLLEQVNAAGTSSPYVMIGYTLRGAKESGFSLFEGIGYSTFTTTATSKTILQDKTFNISNAFVHIKSLPSLNIVGKKGNYTAIGFGIDFLIRASANNNVYFANSAGGYYDYTSPKFKKVMAMPFLETSYQSKTLGLFMNYQFSGNMVDYMSESWSIGTLTVGAILNLKK